jgi:CheY-like chemotaxis protein
MDLLLCVDDDSITIMLSKMVLTRAAYAKEIVMAHNGEEALLYLDDLIASKATTVPALIFLDLNMPVMGGWEFLDAFSEAKYRDVFPDCKVVVLSSTIDPKDIEKSKSYSMVLDFMAKPISKELLEVVTQKLSS